MHNEYHYVQNKITYSMRKTNNFYLAIGFLLFSTLLGKQKLLGPEIAKKMQKEQEMIDLNDNRYDTTVIRQQQKYDYIPEEYLQEDYSLPLWIVDENQQTIKHYNEYKDMIHESLMAHLKHNDQFIFKWSPAQQKQFTMEIYIKFLSKQGELGYPQGQKNEFVEIQAKKEGGPYSFMEKVYYHKRIKMTFNSKSKIIKLKNLYTNSVIIAIKLEWSGTVITEGVSDLQLADEASKASIIFGALKTEVQKLDKISIHEELVNKKREQHYYNFTVTTTIQLLLITVTAYIQVFSTRKLLENKMII